MNRKLAQEILYRSEYMQARRSYIRGGNHADVVTFEYVRMSYDIAAGDEFAANLAEKYNLNVLHAVPKAADWYHYPDTEAWIRSMASDCSKETLAYGSSMGAYAVAHFADRLGIKRGICISPQFSIKREVVPFEYRWKDHAERIDFLRDETSLRRQGMLWVFYDSRSKDAGHAEMIAESGPCELIDVPFGGHPVGFALREAGILTQIFKTFLRGEENRDEFTQWMAALPTKSPIYHLNKGNCADDPKERENCYVTGLEINPGHIGLRHAFGLFLLRGGRVSEAEDMLRPLIMRPQVARGYAAACKHLGVSPRLLAP